MSLLVRVAALGLAAAMYVGLDMLLKDDAEREVERQKEKASSMIAEIITAFKTGGVKLEVKEIMVHMKPIMTGAKRVLSDSNYIRYTASVRVMIAEQIQA